MDKPDEQKLAQTLIAEECDGVKEMLLEKNKSYGNSALQPLRMFAKSDALEQINVRLDDKFNRILKGGDYGNEDTEFDIIGYLVLKRVALRFQDILDPVEVGIGNVEMCKQLHAQLHDTRMEVMASFPVDGAGFVNWIEGCLDNSLYIRRAGCSNYFTQLDEIKKDKISGVLENGVPSTYVEVYKYEWEAVVAQSNS